MKISEAIEALNKVLKDNGDLKVYLDVSEEEPCPTCGESKSHTYDGFCHRITTINIHGEGKCAWLVADRC